jgi:hypothetical protein
VFRHPYYFVASQIEESILDFFLVLDGHLSVYIYSSFHKISQGCQWRQQSVERMYLRLGSLSSFALRSGSLGLGTVASHPICRRYIFIGKSTRLVMDQQSPFLDIYYMCSQWVCVELKRQLGQVVTKRPCARRAFKQASRDHISCRKKYIYPHGYQTFLLFLLIDHRLGSCCCCCCCCCHMPPPPMATRPLLHHHYYYRLLHHRIR